MSIRNIVYSSLVLVLSCTGNKVNVHHDAVQPIAQYLLGVSVLQHNRAVPRFDIRAMRMEQLSTITGLDRDSVIAYLKTIKNRPEAGFLLYEEIKRLCSQNSENSALKHKKE